jgi:mono/diheme cytochrome c family protein
MTRSAGLLVFAAASAGLLAAPAMAQGAATGAGPDLASGRQRFEQSCGVCHTKPIITSGRYGPPLSRESLGGQADVMTEVISNGIPERMPGFRYHMSPAEIRSVVAYIQTLDPPPPEAARPTARTSGERRDDN